MNERVDWVDVAKGICIVMVVMMHSTLGVEKAAGAAGWMGYVVEFARPFRMPDFFLIAGLFLARRIDGPWRLYLDRKVLHFFYFYALWLTIQFAFKAPGIAAESGWDGALREYLFAFVEPWGTLWFIYHLALFLLVTRLLKDVPWVIVWLGAAALEIAHINTGSVLIDEFASRFVYFYSGYVFATHVFRLAEEATADRGIALTGLALWAVLHGVIVFNGYGDLPLVSLALGLAGALAVVTSATVLTQTFAAPALRWLGEHSIVVYLAFFLPMAVARAVLLKTAIITDIGTISVLVTLIGIAGPVLLYALREVVGLRDVPLRATAMGADRRALPRPRSRKRRWFRRNRSRTPSPSGFVARPRRTTFVARRRAKPFRRLALPSATVGPHPLELWRMTMTKALFGLAACRGRGAGGAFRPGGGDRAERSRRSRQPPGERHRPGRTSHDRASGRCLHGRRDRRPSGWPRADQVHRRHANRHRPELAPHIDTFVFNPDNTAKKVTINASRARSA